MILESPIAVLGAGSWGTALALHLSRNGNVVRLWGHRKERISEMRATRINEHYFPDTVLPDCLELFDDLSDCLRDVRDILIVVPSAGFRECLQCIKMSSNVSITELRLVWGTKGLDAETGQLLHQVIQQELDGVVNNAVLSGPSFAQEVVDGLPTAISLAGGNETFLNDLVHRFHSASFRVYKNSDMLGVELCGVMKNVLAVAIGIADGMSYGANTRAALITRGLAEMGRLCDCMGAEPSTLLSLAGVGDTILTCTDDQSRNRRFGLALGAGHSIAEAEALVGQTVEGYKNARQIHQLAMKHKVDMPVVTQVYRVLFDGIAADEAVKALLARTPKSEG